MSINWEMLLIIVVCAVGTFATRVLPIMTMSRFNLPVWLSRWLNYMPISVIAALIGQRILTNNGQFVPVFQNFEILAAALAFLAAAKTGNLLVTVVVGIMSIVAFGFFI